MGVVGSGARESLRVVTVAWYAAYGSNTDEDRLREYLVRCTQPVEPTDSRPFVIDLPLYFAGTSTAWGDGGVAFTRLQRDATPATLARAWLLPAARIAEIGAQENRGDVNTAALDLELVRAAGAHRAFTGQYDAWADCGDLDGLPVVTLTSSTPRAPVRPPSAAYVQVVARGIRVTHGMTREAVADYLSPRTNLPVATLMEWQSGGSG